jgi:hypothetical protein
MGTEEEGLSGAFVIPGRAKREPGISQNNLWIPGLRLTAHPGMTTRILTV